MNAVTFLLLYAVSLCWLAPTLLNSLPPDQIRPRLTTAAWMLSITTAVGAWLAALTILVVGLVHSLIARTTLTFCVETLGLAPSVHLPATATVAAVVALTVITALVALHTATRVAATLAANRRSNREHAEAVSIVGRQTRHPGVVMMEVPQPLAYCVAGGGRSVIVVTQGALRLLDRADLNAVLAHERAHLRGRHHQIVAILNALHSALPRVPLARAAATTVPALLEMCADDTAARSHSRHALLRSIVALSSGIPVPHGALAVAGTAVTDRIARLTVGTPQKCCRLRESAVTAAVVLACLAPFTALALCTL